MKDILRKKYKQIRADIQNKSIKSSIIIDKIFDLDVYKNAEIVCTYVSFGDEVDTYKLIEKSISYGKIVAVPKVIDSNTIEFYRITSLNSISNINSFGINEPEIVRSNLINKDDINLIIVPGICFDKNKNRIGFGKGYYDKYLSNLPSKCLKIGICFDEQLIISESFPTDSFDVKMDMIITDVWSG